MLHAMFHLPVPLLEKILRPILVYLTLVVLLRIFGKRELAQLNPFDLVVLLSLSNTVQNALIGEDSSVTGGAVGAIMLLSINWLIVRLIFGTPWLGRLLAGRERVLIQNGRVDHGSLRRELLTEQELLAVVHRQGFDHFRQVMRCVLGPNGTFYVEGRKPSEEEARHTELLREIRELRQKVEALETQA